MSFLHKIGEFLTPVLTESHFESQGVLTPTEFVLAGDTLVKKSPNWSWQGGDKSHLPKDKQYLLIRNVPCRQRANTSEVGVDDEVVVADELGEDGWTATHATEATLNAKQKEKGKDTEKGKEPAAAPAAAAAAAAAAGGGSDSDSIPDMEDFSGLTEDPSALASLSIGTVKTRVYDMTICYDKYYRVPRMWLAGYDENRVPLKPEQVFEDVSADHANKTVTIETHPYTGVPCASIHPCKHSAVMLKFIEIAKSNGNEIRPDMALFMFLKFISSLVPYIEYDNTGSLRM
jgi:ubiquitin-like-conjugating enzyme ATG3